jgi:hypothetical protein
MSLLTQANRTASSLGSPSAMGRCAVLRATVFRPATAARGPRCSQRLAPHRHCPWVEGPACSRGSRAERNQSVMHVDRREVPMHAAGCTTFCPRHSADDRRVVPRETHDDVEIASRLVLLAQSGDAVCVDGQAMTLYKTRLRRWMYQRSIN